MATSCLTSISETQSSHASFFTFLVFLNSSRFIRLHNSPLFFAIGLSVNRTWSTESFFEGSHSIHHTQFFILFCHALVILLWLFFWNGFDHSSHTCTLHLWLFFWHGHGFDHSTHPCHGSPLLSLLMWRFRQWFEFGASHDFSLLL